MVNTAERNSRHRLKRLCLILPLLLGCLATVKAQSGMPGDPGQDDAAGPAMAIGSGRMVRGTVSAVSQGHLAIKTETGDVFQVAFSANTRLMKGREPIKLDGIHVGDGIGAMGELDQPGKTVHALFVTVVDQEQIRKARESLGKTWIAGTVTAMDEVKLTILRGDKVTQVIQVDEDTSFKRGGRGLQMMMGNGGVSEAGNARQGGSRGAGPANGSGGESITLSDVKVGDNVAGKGVLKNGVFVPTQLAVVDPSKQGRRWRPGDPGTSATEPR